MPNGQIRWSNDDCMITETAFLAIKYWTRAPPLAWQIWQILKFDWQTSKYYQQISFYDQQILKYDQQISKYDQQILTYDQQITKYDQQILKYDEQILRYDQQSVIDIFPPVSGAGRMAHPGPPW